MSYAKQTHVAGQKLTAAQLNHMENGIVAAHNAYNLLDNSDFRNPINQRGIQSGATVAEYTYCLDRWMNFGATAGTLTLSNAGISFTMTNFSQRLPETIKTGTVVTAAAKWNDGTIVTVTGTITRGNEWKWFTASNNGHQIGVIDMGNNKEVHFTIISGSGVVEWAALYEGSYTTETLPAYVPKGYGAELAECQRYYIHLGDTYNAWYVAHKIVGWGSIVEIPTPPMRIQPTLIELEEGIKGFTGAGWTAKGELGSGNIAMGGNKIIILFGNTDAVANGGSFLATGFKALSADL